MNRDRSIAQTLALLFGVVFLVVGIPGITEDAPGSFAGEDSDGSLLGVFQTSVLHNLAHLAFGIGILAARKHATALTYLLVGGIALRWPVSARDPRWDGLAAGRRHG